MADWWVRFRDRAQGNVVGEYSLLEPNVEVRNSEVGGFAGTLALGQKRRNSTTLGITRDQFAPYRSLYEVWRQSSGSGVCISDGFLTSVNLQFNRDTALIQGKDYKHYLERRIYPFNPDYFTERDPDFPEHYLDQWPKVWPTMEVGDQDPIDVRLIIQDLLLSMRTVTPVDSRTTPRPTGTALGVPPFVWNIPNTGIMTKYKILPGDQTTILQHIQRFSEQRNGFEWDILPQTLEFKLWAPTKYAGNIPVYWFAPSQYEIDGPFTEFDWTNDGPEGTYLIGLGSGRHKVGRVWTDIDTVRRFGHFDMPYDFGEMQNTESILQLLKDQNDLWPQKKFNATLLNPEFLSPNFYTGGRPRALIGAHIRVTHMFAPYHLVDAYFKINAIRWNVDTSTNESVALELEMVYEPDTGTSGGINQETQ